METDHRPIGYRLRTGHPNHKPTTNPKSPPVNLFRSLVGSGWVGFFWHPIPRRPLIKCSSGVISPLLFHRENHDLQATFAQMFERQNKSLSTFLFFDRRKRPSVCLSPKVLYFTSSPSSIILSREKVRSIQKSTLLRLLLLLILFLKNQYYEKSTHP